MTELTYKKERRAFVAHSGILYLQEEGDLRSSQVFGYHYRDITVWTELEKGEENELWMPRTLIGKFTPQMIFHPIGEAA